MSDIRGFAINDASFPLSTMYNYYLEFNGSHEGNTLGTSGGRTSSENTLVLQNKITSEFFRVRDPTDHAAFFGNYKLCYHFVRTRRCPLGDRCPFAHNEPELQLWTEEKKGTFSVTEVVSRARSSVEFRTLQAFFHQYPGRLMFVCRLCLTENSRLAGQCPDDIYVCSCKRHSWYASSILAHRMSASSVITLIGQRPTNVEVAYNGLCPLLQYCPKIWTAKCTKAHSSLELQLWCVEQCLNKTQQELVEEVCLSVL